MRAFVPVLALAGAAAFAAASSHREAPHITELPKLDATDFYLFTSYEPGRSGFVTFVADYQPLQAAYGGPNYFTLDPDARYEIKVDNDGDALEDWTYRFSFQNTLKDLALSIGPAGNQKIVSVPLRNIGPITASDSGALNDEETFTIDLVAGTGPNAVVTPLLNAATGTPLFRKPYDNVGNKTFADYAAYAKTFVQEVLLPDGSKGRVFVGQRDDPFVVNLGETFDLVNTNPLGPENGEQDSLATANVTAFVLEVPKRSITLPGNPIVGAWTAASLPMTRVLTTTPTYDQPTLESGPYVQVSRLGMPLVNEVVIGLKDKDRFNASQPAGDAQFADYITHPTLPALLQALFGVQAPTLFPRSDLVAVFATGVAGLNQNGSFGEMLRLDLRRPPTPVGQQHRLGVLGGDLAGFPNGRRPGDDVVDIALRVVMGALLDPTVAPAGQLPYTDGAFLDETYFDPTFPYLRTPFAGAVGP
jgi:hypothetical protein